MRAVAIAILAGATIAGTSGALATPSMSRGQQMLPIDQQECMARGMRTFQTLGWSNIGMSGSFTNAFKGSEGAYITCNQAGATTFVNVFVASDSTDSNVPGAERQKLQAGMENTAAAMPIPPPVGPAIAPVTGDHRWVFTCCGNAWQGDITLTMGMAQGSVTHFTGSFSSGLNGGAIAGQWDTATGVVTFDREISPGSTQHYIGTLVNVGGQLKMSGTWSGAYENNAAHDWSAALQP